MSQSQQSHDFVVTAHAFDRIHDRFPDLVEGMNDQEQARLIHAEVMAALEAGRQSAVAPREFAPHRYTGWVPAAAGESYVWTEDRLRGYVLQDGQEGLLVKTVLIGLGRIDVRARA
jgi:hypothetical protein